MNRPLDQRDLAILRALKASNVWHSRDGIAAMLDKTKLHPEDQIALDCLVNDGRVERSRTGGKGNRIVYRIAQNGGAK